MHLRQNKVARCEKCLARVTSAAESGPGSTCAQQASSNWAVDGFARSLVQSILLIRLEKSRSEERRVGKECA